MNYLNRELLTNKHGILCVHIQILLISNQDVRLETILQHIIHYELN